MKTELLSLAASVDIFLADLSLPQIVYTKFSLEQPTGFRTSGLLKCRFQ
jgi:hypothetical protein